MKSITINDFLDFKYVSAPGFSPDGKYAAFIVQQAALEDNKYVGDIYVLDVADKQYRRLTAAEREKLIEQLTAEMKEAARKLEFEQAAFLRDRIKALKQ